MRGRLRRGVWRYVDFFPGAFVPVVCAARTRRFVGRQFVPEHEPCCQERRLRDSMLTPLFTQILGREGGVRVDWRQYRVAVLKWLDQMGVTGIKALGEATMKGLMGDQEGPKESQDTALS